MTRYHFFLRRFFLFLFLVSLCCRVNALTAKQVYDDVNNSVFPLYSYRQINPTIPGSGADVDATQCPAKDSGADTRTESDPARLG